MSVKFKYDIMTLIHLVESRPCLWDKQSKKFSLVLRTKAWQEVFSILEPNFSQLHREKQKEVGSLIRMKWENIRDAFIRSLRKKSDGFTTKKYLYTNALQFLLKNKISKAESSINKDKNETIWSQTKKETKIVCDESEAEELSDDGEQMSQFQRKKAIPMDDEIDRKISKPFVKTELDEDEAFFISILPCVRQLSGDDKLDFRMSVLQDLKDIKNRSCHNLALKH